MEWLVIMALATAGCPDSNISLQTPFAELMSCVSKALPPQKEEQNMPRAVVPSVGADKDSLFIQEWRTNLRRSWGD